jgi:hypothetical protein
MNLYKYTINDFAVIQYSSEDQKLAVRNKMLSLYEIYTKGESYSSFFVKAEVERLKKYCVDNFGRLNLTEDEILERVLYIIAYQKTIDEYSSKIKMMPS